MNPPAMLPLAGLPAGQPADVAMPRPSWRRRQALALAALWAALATAPAAAHQASDAFVTLGVQGAQLSQRVDIALRDLDRELALDDDEDGQLRWGEVRQRWPQIVHLVEQAITLDVPGQACEAGAFEAPQLTRHSDGQHVVLQRQWQCPQAIAAVGLRYALFADSDASHRGILNWRSPQGGQQQVLVPGPARVVLNAAPGQAQTAADPAPTPGASGFAGFVAEGVHHILIGHDHVLFVLTLLLPAVLLPLAAKARTLGPPARRPASAWAMVGRGQGQPALPQGGTSTHPLGGASALSRSVAQALAPPWAWHDPPVAAPAALWQGAARPAAPAGLADWLPAPRLGPVLLDVARLVSAFTVAHSITLAVAVLGLWQPSSRGVETLIALSVLLAALNNLWPQVEAGRWKLVFAFGLVHGFGFAGALQDLGLDPSALATSLLGFNLGVELGQLAIVGLALPLAWALRGTAFYRRWVLRGGSVCVALIAVVWALERGLDLSLWP